MLLLTFLLQCYQSRLPFQQHIHKSSLVLKFLNFFIIARSLQALRLMRISVVTLTRQQQNLSCMVRQCYCNIKLDCRHASFNTLSLQGQVVARLKAQYKIQVNLIVCINQTIEILSRACNQQAEAYAQKGKSQKGQLH